MKIFFTIIALTAGLLGACSKQDDVSTSNPSAVSQPLKQLDIAYDKFTLENGLRVIVLPDNRLPIASIALLYDVGSKDEVPGKTGLAHLFEHMMFEGSENNNEQIFSQLTELGATKVNGLTSKDYTIYKEKFPIGALERVLWIESDRMGHLLGAITQEKLELAKGAVLSEAAGRLASPLGDWETHQLAGVYTSAHPYGHTVIGGVEDVKNATIEDAHAWFQKYYGANNAVLVLAGDVSVTGARELAVKYFSDVAPGPVLNKAMSNIPQNQPIVEDVLVANTNATTIVRIWAIPGYAEKEFTELQVIAKLLQNHLDAKLVKTLGVAKNVSVVLIPQRLSSQFKVNVVLSEGAQHEMAAQVLSEEISSFLNDRLDSEELESIVERQVSAITAKTESLTALSLLVAEGELAKEDPLHFKKTIEWTSGIQGEDVSSTARKWLSSGYYQMTIKPRGRLNFSPASVDRSSMPTIGVTNKIKFPETASNTFSNGVDLYVTNYGRGQNSYIRALLKFNVSGKLAGEKIQLAVIAKVIEKTANASLKEAGKSSIVARSRVSNNWISISTSMPNLELDIVANILFQAIENPNFTEEDLSEIAMPEVRSVILSTYQQAELLFKSAMLGVALDDLSANINQATEAGEKPSLDTIQNFYNANFDPSGVTVLAVGKLSMNNVMPIIETSFGNWTHETNANAPKTINAQKVKPALQTVSPKPFQPKIYVINQPKQKRATISLGLKIPDEKWELELDVLNHVYGNMVSGRLQKNLRWKRSWTYVATSGVKEFRGVRYLVANTSVDNENVTTSMVEMRRELLDLRKKKVANETDLKSFQNAQIMKSATMFESAAYLISSMTLGLQNDDDIRSLITKANTYADISLKNLGQAAGELINGDKIMWVIIGDAEILVPDLRQLGFGDVIVVEGT